MIVTDTASYSDIVFGLLSLAGFTYAPQLADLPDQKMWRVDHPADYGAFRDAARAVPAVGCHLQLQQGLHPGLRRPGEARRVCVGFRNRTWMSEDNQQETLDFLSGHQLPYVCVDMPCAGQRPATPRIAGNLPPVP